MSRDTIFSLASMTKPMVSVAIMMLHDEGKLFLSDPVGKFLPQLAKMPWPSSDDASGKETETVPAKRQPPSRTCCATPRALPMGAWHHGGAQAMAGLAAVSVTYTARSSSTRRQGAVALSTRHHMGLQPIDRRARPRRGSHLRQIARRLPRGTSLEAARNDRHQLRHPEAKKGRYALAFPNDPLTNKPQSVLHASGKPIKFECGGACAVSSTMDYLRFAQMLVNGGTLDGKRILSRKTVELMTADQLGPEVRARSTHPLLPEG